MVLKTILITRLSLNAATFLKNNSFLFLCFTFISKWGEGVDRVIIIVSKGENDYFAERFSKLSWVLFYYSDC